VVSQVVGYLKDHPKSIIACALWGVGGAKVGADIAHGIAEELTGAGARAGFLGGTRALDTFIDPRSCGN
jgi:hypothetical protein